MSKREEKNKIRTEEIDIQNVTSSMHEIFDDLGELQSAIRCWKLLPSRVEEREWYEYRSGCLARRWQTIRILDPKTVQGRGFNDQKMRYSHGRYVLITT